MWLLYLIFFNPITETPIQTMMYSESFADSDACVEVGAKVGDDLTASNPPVPFQLICVEADRSGPLEDEPVLGKPKPGQIQI